MTRFFLPRVPLLVYAHRLGQNRPSGPPLVPCPCIPLLRNYLPREGLPLQGLLVPFAVLDKATFFQA